MIKRILYSGLLAASLILLSMPVWADPAAVSAVASIAVPAGSPWYATIIAAIFPMLLGALTWLSERISTYTSTKIKEARTSEQGKWYGTAVFLAEMAVGAAETYYGPDTGRGIDKKAKAVAWLKDRLIAMDKDIVKLNPNLDALLTGFVDTAYFNLFRAVSPLAQGAAGYTPTPSASVTGQPKVP